MYDVEGLKHNLLSVSEMCDKGNDVLFTTFECKVTNSFSRRLILRGKRHKNIYKVDIIWLKKPLLKCLSAMGNEFTLWHKRLGHTSFSIINKLVSKELVLGLPEGKVSKDPICGAYAHGKYARSSSQPMGLVSTHRLLELVHIDLCGPMRVQSRGGNRYVSILVNDYSRFT